jgi:hypothetical protein
MTTLDRVTERTRGTGRSWRWRGLYVIGLAAALGAVVAGVTFGYLSASGSGSGSASTGGVAVSINAPATHTCTYTALVPGNLTGSATCALSVTYTGSISAFMSLTVAVQSKAGPGGHTLYDGSGNAGLTLSISDGHHAFTVPTGAGTTGGSCPVGFTCWTTANDLAVWYSGTAPNLTFTSASPAVTWTVTPLFPKTVGNTYQGATAALTLTAQAVQAPANPLPAACTTSTIGLSCPASGGFAWS